MKINRHKPIPECGISVNDPASVQVVADDEDVVTLKFKFGNDFESRPRVSLNGVLTEAKVF